MKFTYRIIWVNPAKNRQEMCDMSDQHIALFVAKKKVSDGMQDVIIQVTCDPTLADPNDNSWPAINANAEDIENKII